jgi:hypothetical protein
MRHNFSSGLHLEINYTWSKELDFVSTAIEDGQGVNSGGTVGSPDLIHNGNNRRYGLSDQPNRFVGIVMYESPFGAGKHFTLSNRIARGLLGNWNTGAVITVNSGFPFVVSGANSGAMSSAVNEIPGVSLTVPADLQHWYDGKTSVTLPCGLKMTPAKNTFLKYNACAFQGEVLTAPNGATIANQYWVGNSNQTNGVLRGPDRFNVDLSLRRTFAVRENIRLQIAADATNVLNHTEYNGNFNGSLGCTVLSGPTTGYGTSTTYGTLGVGTFDPRQVTMHVRVTF